MDFDDKYDNSNKDDNDHDDDDDVIIVENVDQSQIQGTSQKTAAAVEKGMDDKQLVPYFNRYILLIREQQQQKQWSSEEQLHDLITDLFHSLEYKNDESDGKIKEKFYWYVFIYFGFIYFRAINFSCLSNLFRRKRINGYYESNFVIFIY